MYKTLKQNLSPNTHLHVKCSVGCLLGLDKDEPRSQYLCSTLYSRLEKKGDGETQFKENTDDVDDYACTRQHQSRAGGHGHWAVAKPA